MRLDEQRLLRHIGQIYDASLQPALWAMVLDSLRRDMGATCGLMHICDTKTHAPLISADVGVDPNGITVYAEHFYKHDLWAHQFSRANEGDVFIGEQLVAPEVFANSKFLHDFLLPYAGPHALIGVPARNSNFDANFTLIRRRSEGPFDREAIRFWQHLMPHINRSIHVSLKLGNARSIASAIDVATKSVNFGIIVIAYNGKPRFINEIGSRILRADDGVSVTGNGIRAQRGSENIILQRILKGSLDASAGIGIRAGGALRISRPSGRRAYYLLISPINREPLEAAFSLPEALVIIKDPDADIDISAQTLQRIFQLTRAEARLTAKFFETTSLREAANEIGLTEGTARQYLKNVFAKTDTRNQAGLIKLIARLSDVSKL